MFILFGRMFVTQPESEKGQNLVEFAIVFGLLIVVFLGMVEVTNLFQQKSDLDGVVRQAARQAGEFGGGREQVETYIKHQLELMSYDIGSLNIKVTAQELTNSGIITNVLPLTDECSYGDYISVEIQHKWEGRFLRGSHGILTNDPQSGTFIVSHTNRCWRAN